MGLKLLNKYYPKDILVFNKDYLLDDTNKYNIYIDKLGFIYLSLYNEGMLIKLDNNWNEINRVSEFIDPNTGMEIKELKPEKIIVDENTGDIYINNYNFDRYDEMGVLKLDKDFKLISRAKEPYIANYMCLNSDGSKLYLLGQRLVELDTNTMEYSSSFGQEMATVSDDAFENHPNGVCVDKNNFIYVCDSGNNRIVKIDSSNMTYVTQFGITGQDRNDNTGFNYPYSIFIDNNDIIHIFDQISIPNQSGIGSTQYDRIVKIDKDMNFISSTNLNYNIITKYEFSNNKTLFYNNGYIYTILDGYNGLSIIDKYTLQVSSTVPSFITKQQYLEMDRFNKLYTDDKYIYITDKYVKKIIKYDHNLNFISHSGQYDPNDYYDEDLTRPKKIYTDADYNIYVLFDIGIIKLDKDMNFISENILDTVSFNQTVDIIINNGYVFIFYKNGIVKLDTDLNIIEEITINTFTGSIGYVAKDNENIYMIDRYGNICIKMDNTFNIINTFGNINTPKIDNTGLNNATDICINNDNIYILDINRMMVLNSNIDYKTQYVFNNKEYYTSLSSIDKYIYMIDSSDNSLSKFEVVYEEHDGSFLPMETTESNLSLVELNESHFILSKDSFNMYKDSIDNRTNISPIIYKDNTQDMVDYFSSYNNILYVGMEEKNIYAYINNKISLLNSKYYKTIIFYLKAVEYDSSPIINITRPSDLIFDINVTTSTPGIKDDTILDIVKSNKNTDMGTWTSILASPLILGPNVTKTDIKFLDTSLLKDDVLKVNIISKDKFIKDISISVSMFINN